MNDLLPQCKGQYRWIHENGDTRDIISVVMEAVDDPAVKRQTEKLATDLLHKFPSPFLLCEALWELVKGEVTYKEDVKGEQLVKDPACTLGYTADCKSMTVLISSVLLNAGISFKIRFTRYQLLGEFTHVYPVALINGREVPIDAVHHSFNKEVYYIKKKDFKRMTRIARISGFQGQTDRKIPTSGTDGELYLHLLRRQLQLKQLYANDSATKKILGQGMNILDRSITQGLHNLGSRAITGSVPSELQFLGDVIDQAAARNRPATSFKHPASIGTTDYEPTQAQRLECFSSVVTLDTYIDSDGDSCDPTIIGNYHEELGFWVHYDCKPNWDSYPENWFEDCELQKFYENLFNDYLETSSPALLYNFITDENNVPRMKTDGLIKRAEQIRYLGGLQRISGISEANIKMWTRNGIVAVNGQTPEDVIGKWNNATVSDYDAMIGCPPCAIVVPIVVAIIAAVGAVAQTAINAKQKSPTEAAQEQFDRFARPPATLQQVLGPAYSDWNPLSASGGGSGSGGSGSGGGSGGGTGGGSSSGSSSNFLPLALLAGGYYLYKKM